YRRHSKRYSRLLGRPGSGDTRSRGVGLRSPRKKRLSTGGIRRISMDTSIKDFEGAIAELESIVKKLEEGDLALEQSLELYERGVQLSRFCHARLEDAERRIEVLTDRGELKPAPAGLTSDDPDRD